MNITIPEPKYETLLVEVVGETPLLSGKMGDEQTEKIKAKEEGRTIAKEKRDPQAEFRAARHVIGEKRGEFGFPASAFRDAMIEATSLVSPNGKRIMSLSKAFTVTGSHTDLALIADEKGKALSPTLSERLGINPSTDRARVIYAARYDGWRVNLHIEFDAGNVTKEQILNLLQRAGKSVGVGSWRPQCRGSFGRFTIGKVQVVKKQDKLAA